MTLSPVTVHRLSPALKDDYLGFMDGPAFADNPRWRGCYCQFPHLDHRHVDWSARSADENRVDACARIAAGGMQGVLAYRGSEVVGWCNAAPRRLLDAFLDDPIPDADTVGQITCFVVAPGHRRTGVARALLDAACQMLGEQGLRVAEAMPLAGTGNDAQQHHGPLSLYQAAGFTPVRSLDDGRVVVRRALP